MSKRFGRNQRRRAREEIARLTEAHAMQVGLARHMHNELDQLRGEVADAKRRFARASVLFQPQSQALNVLRGNFGNVMRMGVEESFKLSDFADDKVSDRVLDRVLHQVPLYLLDTKLMPDVMDDALHVRVVFADETVAYGISRKAWLMMTYEDRTYTLTREIARGLAHELQGVIGRRWVR